MRANLCARLAKAGLLAYNTHAVLSPPETENGKDDGSNNNKGDIDKLKELSKSKI